MNRRGGLTLFHPAGRMGIKTNPFGKDVANAGLFRALIRHGGFAHVHVATSAPVSASELASDCGADPSMMLTTGLATDVAPLRETGAMLRGQADLAELAWMRRAAGGDHLWSLTGLVHTLAPPAIRAVIAEAALAPVRPWDAIVCTSPAVKTGLEAMFDDLAVHIGERFGGHWRERPMLPVIPLGVDADVLARARGDGAARAALRARLRLDKDDVLIAWVGRLSFFEKAFPQPMFRAVAEAAAATPNIRLHFALAGWFPGENDDRRRYAEAARAYAPEIDVSFLDGNDPANVNALWAAADIFISLVDNIQETFGITPLEAMAAGLPVVVSDWDGYRSTVRDGVDGVLVRTLISPAGEVSEAAAARHNLGMQSYQVYVGGIAQHTAVDVGAAASALAQLAREPALRLRMGEAARRNVLDRFNWPVIARLYAELFEEQARARSTSSHLSKEVTRLNPVKGDPLRDFAGFATSVLQSDTRVRLRTTDLDAEVTRIAHVELDRAFASWRARPQDILDLLARLSLDEPIRVCELVGVPPSAHLLATITWLAKLGILAWE